MRTKGIDRFKIAIYLTSLTFITTTVGINCQEITLKNGPQKNNGNSTGSGNVVWQQTTGQGNPGETCQAWLARTGQPTGSKKINYTLTNTSNPAFQNVEVGNACAYLAFWTSADPTTGACGYYDSEQGPNAPFGFKPVSSCTLFTGEVMQTSVASGDAKFTTGHPPFENGWKLATGQSNLSEGCIAWLDRTTQRSPAMTPEVSIRTIYFGVINPEVIPSCEGKTTFPDGSTQCGRDHNMWGGFTSTRVVGDCTSDKYGNWGSLAFSTQTR